MAAFESFDGVTAPVLPVDWTQSTTSTNAWTTVGNTSDSAPNHAFVANVANVSESILTSPTFTLPPATPLLSFRNNFNTEATWDGGVLEISMDGGLNFADILAAGGSFVSGGYRSALVTSGNGNTSPLAGRQAWHGDSVGYITTVVNLPAAALGQSIALRWRFGSDSSVGVTGWRIDTITLESLPPDDFGDAPTSYPVTLAENGARHTVGALFMGAQVDTETDGSHSSNAVADGADEDGVNMQGTFARGNSKTIQVTASQAGGLLNAWFDWNADGDWVDSGEQVFVDQALAAGPNSLSVSVPSNAKIGNTFARFRLGTAGGLSFTGPATDGEVEDYRLTVIGAGVWNPLGPFGATDGQVEGIAGKEVVGAVHTVLAHPTNADILYIGATNGGVWKTTNATSSSPNWMPLTDGIASQSIGALAFDLADPTFNTIYAGIGQYSSFNRIGNTRIGLIRSTDGGQNWQVVSGTGPVTLQGKNISGVYANGNTVVVSVNVADAFTFSNVGIFRSTDGGSTFSQVSQGNGTATGLPGGVSYDLVVDPMNPTTLYTSTVFSDGVGGVSGVYKSTNSGANWVKVSTPAMDALITNNTSNLELAVGRSNEVYAGIINAGAFAGLFRSPDGGANWSQMDSPKTNENGIDVGLNPSGGKGPSTGAPEAIAGGQGSIHFSIVADPNNSNLVYVGGDRQPRANGDTGGFPNSIGASDFSGRLFRGDASQPLGSQFVHLTHSSALGAPGGGTAGNSSPHADSREMTFDANGNLIEVDDGGVYRRTSPQNNTGDWFSMIGNLSVTEAHDVAWDSLSNVAITGNQDTGTTLQPSANSTQWVSLTTADGGDVAVDNIELSGSNQSVRYTSFQNLGGFVRTVWNSAGAFVDFTRPNLFPNGGAAAITGAFRTPVETNSVAGGRLLIQGTNGLYESLDAGATVNAIGVGRGVIGSGISQNAIWYGGTQNNVPNPNLVWAASDTDVFVRTSGTGNVVGTAADPTTSVIRDLAVNSRDWANAFVIDDNQVFQTVNVGASWSDITGNLMTFASSLRSIAFVAGAFVNSIVVGTNAGVFSMLTNALGTWSPVGTGLPNVLAYDLDFDATDDTLVVGTLGRGAWSLLNATQVVTDRTAPATNSFARSVPSSATTSADSLVFLVTFNEPVTGVDAADFAATGTTGSISVNQITTSTYSVTISGGNLASLNGTVGLNFSASPTITDLALNPLPNAEPTIDESYLVDNTLPQLVSIIVNGGDTFANAAQRSQVTSLTVTFSEPVVIASGAFTIVNNGLVTAQAPVAISPSQILVSGSGTTYTIRFDAGAGVDTRSVSTGLGRGNSLKDGNYLLTIDPSQVTDIAVQTLNPTNSFGDGDNEFGDRAVDNFFRLFGDADGNGLVNSLDTGAFARATTAYNAAVDFNGDGLVQNSGVDRSHFLGNFNKRRRSF